jgi:hypothetical protein
MKDKLFTLSVLRTSISLVSVVLNLNLAQAVDAPAGIQSAMKRLTHTVSCLAQAIPPGDRLPKSNVPAPGSFSVPLTSPSSVNLTEQYWPMHDGDWRILENTIQGEYISLNESYSYDFWNNMFLLYISESDYFAFGYEGDNVMWYGLGSDWFTLWFDTPIIFVKGSALPSGGNWAGTTTTSYGGVRLTIRASFTLTVAGTVTIPLGTFSDCRKLALSFSVSAPGQGQSLSTEALMLTPGTGYIQEAVLGNNDQFAGWANLTSGEVGGVQVPIPQPDMTAPSLVLTSPKAGQRWSNEWFTVSGTARDNSAVTNVSVQVNDTGWNDAASLDNWSNWNYSAQLTPGTNKIQVLAADSSGNLSPISTSTVLYVLSDRITLLTNPPGAGTISGVASGQMLEINRKATATAKAAGGWAFTNWTTCAGEVLTNKPVITFVMESNLCLQANFVDVTPPTMAITAPTANQRWSNALFTVNGTAKDNAGVVGVWCQTNGFWGPASTANGWTNWTMDVALAPGTNTVRAYALDGAGNKSLTNSVNIVYVLSDRLLVRATGSCAMSPNYSNAVLEIGKRYTTTITPGKGSVLVNWVGTVLSDVVVMSNAPRLTFTMQSNLVLQANIIPNPFVSAKGTYSGLFAETNRTQESSGFLSLTLTDKGSYSASLKQGGNSYRLTGQFDMAGQASAVVLRRGASSWALPMQLDFAAQQLRGWVSNNVSGGWVADLVADRAVFNSRTNPATQYAGKYTVNIPGGTNEDGSVWLGDGYLTLSVDTGGKATYGGSLADGTSVGPVSVPVARDGFLPLYAPLYRGGGSVWSGLLLDTNWPSASVQGWLSWIKPAQGTPYYPGGLKSEVMASGARYTPPATSTSRVIGMTNGVVIFEGGDLSVPLTNAVTLTSANKVTDLSLSNKLSLKLTVSSGAYSGSLTKPGKKRADSFKGALFQDVNGGYGYFAGTNGSGRVLFWPAP